MKYASKKIISYTSLILLSASSLFTLSQISRKLDLKEPSWENLLAYIGFFSIVWFLFKKYFGYLKSLGYFLIGNAGENRVEKVLSQLGEEYKYFRNFKNTKNKKEGDIDFVVIGPSGCFMIEVKVTEKTNPLITLKNGSLYINKRDRTDYLHQAKWQAIKLNRILKENSQHNPFVQSVLVFGFEDMQTKPLIASSYFCRIIGIKDLEKTIKNPTKKLTQNQIQDLVRTCEQYRSGSLKKTAP